MNKELKWLRDLYLEDLGKTVCYDGYNKRPRVRHIQLWESIQTSLKESIETPVAFPTDKNVWLWSDLHYGHNNIISFSDRPFMTLDEMHDHLLGNFNDYVGPDDISIWVGDITFKGNDVTNEWLDQFNGYKILVVGNHDFNKKKIRDLNFDEIHLLQHIEVEGVDLVLTHYPMENLPLPYINVHGHLHAGAGSHAKMNSLQHINVNCEFHSYKPVNLTEIVRMAKTRVDSMEL